MALQALAERGAFRPDTVRLVQSPVVRGGSPCGVLYTLLGPRRTQLTAVWDIARQELWCYDSRGRRFSTRPTAAPGSVK
ncbi:MAG: hypothetical protein AAFV43_05295 [Planctomycetota bacterium]